MFCSKQKLGSAIPYSDNNLVKVIERLQWITEYPRESKITDFDLATTGDHDVSRFEISMEDPIIVKVAAALKKLIHDGSHRHRWKRSPDGWIEVVLDYLK